MTVLKQILKNPTNAEEKVTSQVAEDLHNKLFKAYTSKQKGVPKELSTSVTGRIPVRTNRYDRCFTDIYQDLPKHGYLKLFKRMLSYSDLRMMFQTDYLGAINQIKFQRLVYAGTIDSFSDYKFANFGNVVYGLNLQHSTKKKNQDYQQINYPNRYGLTRIMAWKHGAGPKNHLSIITREHSLQIKEGRDK